MPPTLYLFLPNFRFKAVNSGGQLSPAYFARALYERYDWTICLVGIGDTMMDIDLVQFVVPQATAAIYNLLHLSSDDIAMCYGHTIPVAAEFKRRTGCRMIQYCDQYYALPGNEETDIAIICGEHMLWKMNEEKRLPQALKIKLWPPIPFNDLLSHGGSILHINQSASKGGDIVWEIAKLLPQKKFLFVQGYDDQIEKDLPNVQILPVQHYWDMPKIYRRARLFLNTSRRETLGRVNVEAMSYGIPVLFSPTEGSVETSADYGIRVGEPENPEAWVAEIRELDDPSCHYTWLHRALAGYSYYHHVSGSDVALIAEALRC